jgi:hypothetical protein
VSVKRFLVQLKRHHPTDYAALPSDQRERYETTESRLFGQGTRNPIPAAEPIQLVAEDMALLIAAFEEDEKIADRSSYKSLIRLFEEHCEITPEEAVALRKKSIDTKGQSARTLQNPSDSEAGYDGHKGAGYQVQLNQAFDTGEGPGLVTGCLAESAAESDSAALAKILEQQERMGTLPEEQLADTAYGSQANVDLSAEKNVDLVAPVPGRSATEEEAAEEVAAVAEDEKAITSQSANSV